MQLYLLRFTGRALGRRIWRALKCNYGLVRRRRKKTGKQGNGRKLAAGQWHGTRGRQMGRHTGRTIRPPDASQHRKSFTTDRPASSPPAAVESTELAAWKDDRRTYGPWSQAGSERTAVGCTVSYDRGGGLKPSRRCADENERAKPREPCSAFGVFLQHAIITLSYVIDEPHCNARTAVAESVPLALTN